MNKNIKIVEKVRITGTDMASLLLGGALLPGNLQFEVENLFTESEYLVNP